MQKKINPTCRGNLTEVPTKGIAAVLAVPERPGAAPGRGAAGQGWVSPETHCIWRSYGIGRTREAHLTSDPRRALFMRRRNAS